MISVPVKTISKVLSRETDGPCNLDLTKNRAQKPHLSWCGPIQSAHPANRPDVAYRRKPGMSKEGNMPAKKPAPKKPAAKSAAKPKTAAKPKKK